MSDQPLLQMQGIKKSFVGVEVLHGVDLDLRAGEIHAIVGENGAGKSTLMKTLAGVHMPTEGTIRINGEEQTFHHPAAAQHAGVGIVYQEFNLLPDRNVAENVFVGREPRKGPIVDGRKMERDTAALLEEVGESGFGPRTPVRWLSVAQQQVVEIIKARSLNAQDPRARRAHGGPRGGRGRAAVQARAPPAGARRRRPVHLAPPA